MRPIRQSASIAAETPVLCASDTVGAKNSAGRSLWQVLHANAIEWSGSTAYRAKLRGLWKSWTWVEVEREVVGIHGMLVHAGVRRGTRVAIGGETNPRLYWYVLAIQRAGALPILINSRIGSSEFASLYAKAEFAFFVAGSEAQVEVAVNARSLCPELCLVIALDRGLEVDDHGGLVAAERDLQSSDRTDITSRAMDCSARPTRLLRFRPTMRQAKISWSSSSHASVAKAAREFASLAGMKCK